MNIANSDVLGINGVDNPKWRLNNFDPFNLDALTIDELNERRTQVMTLTKYAFLKELPYHPWYGAFPDPGAGVQTNPCKLPGRYRRWYRCP